MASQATNTSKVINANEGTESTSLLGTRIDSPSNAATTIGSANPVVNAKLVSIVNGGVEVNAIFADGSLQHGGGDVGAPFNVVSDFGADPTGATDSRARIQAALDAAQAVTLVPVAGVTSRQKVFFPPGTYRCDAPLFIGGAGIAVEGSGPNSSYAGNLGGAANWFGPGIVASQDSEFFFGSPYVASLVSGPGRAWNLDTDYNLQLDWGGCTKTLNGFANFCVEFFIKLNQNETSNGGYVVSSTGSVLFGTGGFLPTIKNQCFAMLVGGPSIVATNKPIGKLTVGGTTFTLQSSTALTLGVVTHVAMSYDGTTIRLFQGGVLVASQAASGTITQSQFESVVLGPEFLGYPANVLGRVTPSAFAYVDSVNIGVLPKYTSNFSPPTSKVTPTAGTIMCLNFETYSPGNYQPDIWCKGTEARTGFGHCPSYYFPLAVDGGNFFGVRFREMAFGGIYAQGCNSLFGENLNLSSSQGWGWFNITNGYLSNLSNVNTATSVSSGQSGGVISTFGPNTVTNHTHTGGGTALGGWGMALKNAYYNSTASIVVGIGTTLGQSGWNIAGDGVNITDEGSSTSNILMYIMGGRAVFRNSTFDHVQHTGPAIQLSGPDNDLHLYDCEFDINPGATAVIEQYGAHAKYDIVVSGPRYWNGSGGPNGVPLTNDALLGVLSVPETAGDVAIDAVGDGVTIRSPDGTKYRIQVANGGALSTTPA